MYNPYAIGTRVYLRHPLPEDVEGRWHEWFSDEQTMLWVGGNQWPNAVEKQRDFYNACLKSTDRMVLSVIDRETDRHIGVCNLSAINQLHRYCDIAVVIGEQVYRTGPYVLDTLALLLRTAFLRLNLRNVRASYAGCNQASASMLKVLRFREVGRVPDLLWIDGRYVDSVTVLLSRDEWMRRNAPATQAP